MEFRTEFLEWDDFLRKFRWRQGDHATFIAPTKAGKTTLALKLVEIYRTYVLVLGTKRKDPQLDALKRKGYREIDRMARLLWDRPKHILRPQLRSLSDRTQRYEFEVALDTVFRSGNFTLFADELVFITDDLGLRRHWVTLLRQGRTLGITVLSLSQRPAWVPRECYSQATHIFFAKTTDRTDLDRIADITGGIDKVAVRHDVQRLRQYEWLWIDRDRAIAYRIRMPRKLAGV